MAEEGSHQAARQVAAASQCSRQVVWEVVVERSREERAAQWGGWEVQLISGVG